MLPSELGIRKGTYGADFLMQNCSRMYDNNANGLDVFVLKTNLYPLKKTAHASDCCGLVLVIQLVYHTAQ